MKLDSKFTNNYFKCYNEAKGVAEAKSLILKKKDTAVTTHLQNIVFFSLIILLISIICLLFKQQCLFYLIAFINMLYFFTNIIYMLEKTITGPHIKGTTMITRDGIMNNSYQNIQMLFTWDLIKGVVIKKYTVTILTSTSCYFYFDISYKDKIIDTLEKYNKKKLLINDNQKTKK